VYCRPACGDQHLTHCRAGATSRSRSRAALIGSSRNHYYCIPHVLVQQAWFSRDRHSTSILQSAACSNMHTSREIHGQRTIFNKQLNKEGAKIVKRPFSSLTRPGGYHYVRTYQWVTCAIDHQKLGSSTLEVPRLCFGVFEQSRAQVLLNVCKHLQELVLPPKLVNAGCLQMTFPPCHLIKQRALVRG
jgi:hypothetical protein